MQIFVDTSPTVLLLYWCRGVNQRLEHALPSRITSCQNLQLSCQLLDLVSSAAPARTSKEESHQSQQIHALHRMEFGGSQPGPSDFCRQVCYVAQQAKYATGTQGNDNALGREVVEMPASV